MPCTEVERIDAHMFARSPLPLAPWQNQALRSHKCHYVGSEIYIDPHAVRKLEDFEVQDRKTRTKGRFSQPRNCRNRGRGILISPGVRASKAKQPGLNGSGLGHGTTVGHDWRLNSAIEIDCYVEQGFDER